jgi:hypothetical protein
MKNHRARYWVDTGFQLRLLLRMGLYVLGTVLVVFHVAFVFEMMWKIISQSSHSWFLDSYLDFFGRQRFLLLGLVLLLPMLLRDMLKFSNRFAGPLYCCRRTLEEMASGKTVDELTPGKHELLPELFQAFNKVIQEWNARVAAKGNGDLQHANGARTVLEERPSRAPGDGWALQSAPAAWTVKDASEK